MDFILNVIGDNSDANKKIAESTANYEKLATVTKETTDLQKKGFKESADAAKAHSEAIKDIPEKTKKIATELQKLKQEIKDYKNEALKAGEATPVGQEFLRKAAEATDRLGDLNQAVKKLSSDTQALDALTGAARGIAAGFSIAQGAAAVFGAESEDLQKQLVKVQGAMALLNGLTEAGNLLQKESALRLGIASAAQKVAAVSARLFGAATTAALGPIGLIIGVLGLAVAAFQLFSREGETTKETLDRIDNSLKNVGNSLEDQILKKMDRAGQSIANQIVSIRKSLAELENLNPSKKREELIKEANEKLKKLDEEATLNSIDQLEKRTALQLERAKAGGIEKLKVLRDNLEAEKNLQDARDADGFKITGILEEARQKTLLTALTNTGKLIAEEQKKIDEKKKSDQEKLNNLIDEINRIAQEQQAQSELERALVAEEQRFDALAKRAEGHTKLLAKIEEERAVSLGKIRVDFAEKEYNKRLEEDAKDLERQKAKKDADAKSLQDLSDLADQLQAERIAKAQQAQEQEAAIKAAALQNSIDVFGQLAQLAEAGSEQQALLLGFQKAAAILQIVLSTQVAVMKALAEGGPIFGPIAAGFIIAKGALSAAFVASQQPPTPPKFQKGFRFGGYTGDVAVDEVAGVTHGKEFVNTADTTRKHRPILEALHTEDYSHLTLPDLAPLLEGTGIVLRKEVAGDAINNYTQTKEAERENRDNATRELAEIKKKMSTYFDKQENKSSETVDPDGTRRIRKGNTIRIIRKRK